MTWLIARRLLLLMLVLAIASVAGCRIFDPVERLVFVEEAVTADGEPRQVLRTVEPIVGDFAYYNGSEWVVVRDQEAPAGWLLVSPAVLEQEDK